MFSDFHLEANKFLIKKTACFYGEFLSEVLNHLLPLELSVRSMKCLTIFKAVFGMNKHKREDPEYIKVSK